MRKPPNNPRHVLVWYKTNGWMIGYFEAGVWRLIYEDSGIHIAAIEYVLHWQELPAKPDFI